MLITASADTSAKMWDVETGKEVHSITYKAPARWIEFAEGDRQFLTLTDQVMGQNATMHIYNLTSDGKGL